MAGKAKMLQTVIEQALLSDDANEENSSLQDQMAAFQRILIHDIQASEFADIYAQTIAYGMFAARLNDPSLDTFSRREAAELIPKTNPFLRKLFSYIAGIDIDDRITWIVDALADVFRATDVAKLLENFGKATQMNDPIIHFYETFLAEYNPKLRKSRGVWYTPESVVSFIVRAVDDILKTEFGLPQGLADTSKTTIEVDTQVPDKRSKTGYKRETQELHRVQILDPAAGTGTFLAEVISQVHQKFAGQKGLWSRYVEEHLIPRLHGFEILMASYAMAHLKLDLLLRETGYIPKTQQRFRVFLTNSLEEAHPDTGTLFASWLSREATEANYIKRDTPVMVILGNPPYSISSSNKGKWIDDLMEDYKRGLTERNLQPLSDDYIKFIRYGQYLVEKNGEGILAFITNNSYLDGIIHGQMRKSLYATFDKIYILDLHGSLKRKEVTSDGGKDQNVFDIQPGVSIAIFVKAKGLEKSVHIYDMLGGREEKYAFCRNNRLSDIQWQTVELDQSTFLFKHVDLELKKRYDQFFSVCDLFQHQTSGVKTHNDSVLVGFSPSEVAQNVTKHYDVTANSDVIKDYAYRPFDNRVIYYDTSLVVRAREKTIYHFTKPNIGLILVRQSQAINTMYFDAIFVTKFLTDTNAFRRGGPLLFPLYVYPRSEEQTSLIGIDDKSPNLNPSIVQKFSEHLGIPFDSVTEKRTRAFTPINLFDYVYATLHSHRYREKYKEFLKIDFPRIPCPQDADTFWQLVTLGKELRLLHLLEGGKVEQYITSYPEDGNNVITRKITRKDYELYNEQAKGRVWINDTQYFDGVPQIAWDFSIGGYQPAQKWLKNREGRELTFEDILHYQKIIVSLTETDRIMKEIDTVNFME